MNSLGEVCLVGLEEGGNYVSFLVIDAISMRLGGFKVIILREVGRGRGQATKRRKSCQIL